MFFNILCIISSSIRQIWKGDKTRSHTGTVWSGLCITHGTLTGIDIKQVCDYRKAMHAEMPFESVNNH